MTTTTESAQTALLRHSGTGRRPIRLLHPRLAILLMPVFVALTAFLLSAMWPIGVLVGFATCTLAVVSVGVALQRTARAVPVSDELAVRLGADVPAPSRTAEDATEVAAPANAAQPVAAEYVAEPVAAYPTPVEHALAPAAVAEYAGEVDDEEERLVRAEIERVAVAQHEAEQAAIARRAARVTVPDDVERLRADLGDDYDDFVRAARLVVETQYASAARLQRELGVPYSRARRLLDGLETEHFVGPATGTLPRQVRVPKERLPELERLLDLA